MEQDASHSPLEVLGVKHYQIDLMRYYHESMLDSPSISIQV